MASKALFLPLALSRATRGYLRPCSRIWLLLLLPLLICESANHHCVKRHTVPIELNDFYHRDETLMPHPPEGYQRNRWEPDQCKWDIVVNSQRRNRQLVLQGLPASENASVVDEKGSPGNKLLVSVSGRSVEERLTAGLFRVLPLDDGTRIFSVKLTGTTDSSSVKLRLLLLPQEGCARDMLRFHGNCYAESPVSASATAALANIKGTAQMTSFNTLAEIQEFIATNNAKVKEFPFKRPISLKESFLRVGLFYKADDASLLVARRSGISGVYDLQTLNRTLQDFRVSSPPTGPCASLSVDASDVPTLKFGECDTPMPTLLRFPEASFPGEGSNFDGSCDTKIWQGKLRGLQRSFDKSSVPKISVAFPPKTTAVSRQMGQPNSHMGHSGESEHVSTTVIIVGSVGALALLASVMIVTWFARRCFLNRQQRQPTRGRDFVDAEVSSAFDIEMDQHNEHHENECHPEVHWYSSNHATASDSSSPLLQNLPEEELQENEPSGQDPAVTDAAAVEEAENTAENAEKMLAPSYASDEEVNGGDQDAAGLTASDLVASAAVMKYESDGPSSRSLNLEDQYESIFEKFLAEQPSSTC